MNESRDSYDTYVCHHQIGGKGFPGFWFLLDSIPHDPGQEMFQNNSGIDVLWAFFGVNNRKMICHFGSYIVVFETATAFPMWENQVCIRGYGIFSLILGFYSCSNSPGCCCQGNPQMQRLSELMFHHFWLQSTATIMLTTHICVNPRNSPLLLPSSAARRQATSTINSL